MFEIDEQRILDTCRRLKKGGADGFLEVLFALADEYLEVLEGAERTKEENEKFKTRLVALAER